MKEKTGGYISYFPVLAEGREGKGMEQEGAEELNINMMNYHYLSTTIKR